MFASTAAWLALQCTEKRKIHDSAHSPPAGWVDWRRSGWAGLWVSPCRSVGRRHGHFSISAFDPLLRLPAAPMCSESMMHPPSQLLLRSSYPPLADQVAPARCCHHPWPKVDNTNRKRAPAIENAAATNPNPIRHRCDRSLADHIAWPLLAQSPSSHLSFPPSHRLNVSRAPIPAARPVLLPLPSSSPVPRLRATARAMSAPPGAVVSSSHRTTAGDVFTDHPAVPFVTNLDHILHQQSPTSLRPASPHASYFHSFRQPSAIADDCVLLVDYPITAAPSMTSSSDSAADLPP